MLNNLHTPKFSSSSFTAKEKRKKKKYEYNTDLLLARALLFLGTNQLELDQRFSSELEPVQSHYLGIRGCKIHKVLLDALRRMQY